MRYFLILSFLLVACDENRTSGALKKRDAIIEACTRNCDPYKYDYYNAWTGKCICKDEK
jgi:hypothetical protein